MNLMVKFDIIFWWS